LIFQVVSRRYEKKSLANNDLLQSKETIQMNLHEIRRVHDPDSEMPT
jgi:hypothetical protein